MIPVIDKQIFTDALTELSAYKRSLGRYHKGRFIQLFLALKFFQNQLPSMFSGQFVSTAVLQTMLDDLYSKASLPADRCVLMIFEGKYHPRTGLRRGQQTPANTWRNNFNLQKGVGCYAPPNDLASQVFLDEPRSSCRHLLSSLPNTLSGGHCALCPTGAAYRNENHRKWLRIDSGGSGYAVLDLLNEANYIPYVVPQGHRIPIIPIIIAIYHDALPGLVTGSRSIVDVVDFAADFNFSASEITTYFDDDPTNIHNANILRAYPEINILPIVTGQPVLSGSTHARATRRTRTHNIPSPVLSGTQAPPPVANTGWEAEQFVADALRADGWTVYDLTRQKVGYDLLIQRGRQTKYVDVKSSMGLCSPVLTAREWQQAQTHEVDYLLAIIENFNPISMNTIYWVSDPTNVCQAGISTTIQYGIPRSSWVGVTVSLQNI